MMYNANPTCFEQANNPEGSTVASYSQILQKHHQNQAGNIEDQFPIAVDNGKPPMPGYPMEYYGEYNYPPASSHGITDYFDVPRSYNNFANTPYRRTPKTEDPGAQLAVPPMPSAALTPRAPEFLAPKLRRHTYAPSVRSNPLIHHSIQYNRSLSSDAETNKYALPEMQYDVTPSELESPYGMPGMLPPRMSFPETQTYHAPGYEAITPSYPPLNDLVSPNTSNMEPIDGHVVSPNSGSDSDYYAVEGGRSSDERRKRSSVCPICKKVLKRDLTRHMRTHEEVGRFICPFPREQCSHKRGQFNRPYDFKKHLLHQHFNFDKAKQVRKYRDLQSKLTCHGKCPCGQGDFLAQDWLSNHVLGGDNICPLIKAPSLSNTQK